MGEYEWIKCHVEQLLQDDWDVCRVEQDGDGDYPFRNGTAACWVSVLPSEPVMVRVFAHAAGDLKPTAGLLRELNEIQTHSLSTSLTLLSEMVMVSQTISPIRLTQPVLTQALGAVGAAADDIGALLASVFGGTTPYPVNAGADEEAA